MNVRRTTTGGEAKSQPRACAQLQARRGQQGAFVRNGFASGAPVNTGNNARNFTFGAVVKHPGKPRKPTHKPTKKHR